MTPPSADEHLSWWCGLTWDEFSAAVEAHVKVWKTQKKGQLDFVGGILMRDAWEPRRDPTPKRT